MEYQRGTRSHVREDGAPKKVFETEEGAAQAANLIWAKTGKPQGYYLCEQKPSHWHVGSGVHNLEVNR